MKRVIILLAFFLPLAVTAQKAVKKKDLIGTWKLVKLEMPDLFIVDEDTIIFMEKELSSYSVEQMKSMRESLRKSFTNLSNASMSFKEDWSFVTLGVKDGEEKRDMIGRYKLKEKGHEVVTSDDKGIETVFEIISVERKDILVVAQKNKNHTEIIMTCRYSN